MFFSIIVRFSLLLTADISLLLFIALDHVFLTSIVKHDALVCEMFLMKVFIKAQWVCRKSTLQICQGLKRVCGFSFTSPLDFHIII